MSNSTPRRKPRKASPIQTTNKGNIPQISLSEYEIQQQFFQEMTLRRFTVLTTSHRRRNTHCPKCHATFFPTEGLGTSKGIPDHLVWKPSWGYRMIGVELKRKGGSVRPEQQELEKSGMYRIFDNARDAVDWCISMDKIFTDKDNNYEKQTPQNNAIRD